MKPSFNVVLALLGLANAAAIASAPLAEENAVVASQPESSDVVLADTDELEKREQCRLIIQWDSNWTEIGARYRVWARAIAGPNYPDAPAMAAFWALKCRTGADTSANTPMSWIDPNDNTKAWCDVSFPHGPIGHNSYKWWHQMAWESWGRGHPGCLIDHNV